MLKSRSKKQVAHPEKNQRSGSVLMKRGWWR